MIVKMKGRNYAVHYDGTVEVYVPGGEPRVMRDARPAVWRTLPRDGPTAKRVRAMVGEFNDLVKKEPT